MNLDHLTLTIPVKDGELRPSAMQKANMDGFLARRNGKTVTITLERPVQKRTTEQNRYYWGVVLTTIASHCGHSTEEVHEAIKELFLPRQFVKLGNREVQIEKSTTKLTQSEFAQFLEQVRAWAAQELGITFPELDFKKAV